MSTPEKRPSLLDKATIENVVVLLMVCTFIAVIAVGLYIAVTGGKIDVWQTVALFFSGFFTGILTAYGLFKAAPPPTT